MTDDAQSITVEVPFIIRRRGGRKQVITPDGAPAFAPPRPRIDNAMVKALARAFRWRKLLESGAYGTIDEIAKAEKINPSYVSRVLRMTLLAPEIVEAILDGRQENGLTLAKTMEPFPMAWGEQTPQSCLRHTISHEILRHVCRKQREPLDRRCLRRQNSKS
jgi:hypothetical protein